MDADVLIIGGGPAGLAAAMWESRTSSRPRVRVLEAGPRIGGWVRSERRDGYLCEHGPQAIRASAEFTDFVSMLGIEEELVAASPESSTRWLGRRGRLRAVPTRPLPMLMSGLLSLRGKLRLLREPRVASQSSADGGESVAGFCERRLGREAVPLVQAMIGGVYAGDAQQLEVASALPILTQFEGEQGSVLRGIRARRQAKKSSAGPSSAQQVFSFRDGIEGLVNRLAAAAPGQVELDAAVDSVAYDGGAWAAKMRDGSEHRAPRLIMACPARVSARLLAAVAPALSAELAEIPFASLASVYLGMPMTTLPSKLSGFGFLLETEPGNPVLGAIYASQLFPDHAPPGHQLVRVMMGGSLHPSAVDCEDTDLIDSAVAAMRRYVGLDVAPTFTHVVRARQAIPQFELGHKPRRHRITDMLGQCPGLRLCGNSYHNVALTAQLSRRAGLQSSATNCSEEVAR